MRKLLSCKYWATSFLSLPPLCGNCPHSLSVYSLLSKIKETAAAQLCALLLAVASCLGTRPGSRSAPPPFSFQVNAVPPRGHPLYSALSPLVSGTRGDCSPVLSLLLRANAFAALLDFVSPELEARPSHMPTSAAHSLAGMRVNLGLCPPHRWKAASESGPACISLTVGKAELSGVCGAICISVSVTPVPYP